MRKQHTVWDAGTTGGGAELPAFSFVAESHLSQQYTETGREQYPWHDTETLESAAPLHETPTQDTAEELVLDAILGATQPDEALASEDTGIELPPEATPRAAQVAEAPAAALGAEEPGLDCVAESAGAAPQAEPGMGEPEAEGGGDTVNADDATKAGESHAMLAEASRMGVESSRMRRAQRVHKCTTVEVHERTFFGAQVRQQLQRLRRLLRSRSSPPLTAGQLSRSKR